MPEHRKQPARKSQGTRSQRARTEPASGYAKKSLGQNFLMHAQTADRIASVAGVSPETTVLEIGPGRGQLTRALLARAGKVIAVEADDSLIPELAELFAEEIARGKFTLIHADIRTFDPASIAGPYTLVANIPYYITGEIIRQFLSTRHKPASMTLLVQKEVAERIVRDPKESLLSLSVKVYGVPQYRFTVPKGAFKPAPKVDSAVISITDIRDSFENDAAERWFFQVIRAGFAHKRKQLGGNLADIAPTAAVEAALSAAQVSLKARPEDVSLSAWRTIASTLAP